MGDAPVLSEAERPARTELKVTTGPIRGSRKIYVGPNRVGDARGRSRAVVGRAAGHALRHQRPLHRPRRPHRHHGRPARAARAMDPRPRRRRGSRRSAKSAPRTTASSAPTAAAASRPSPPSASASFAPGPATTSARCTTPAAASSRPRWNMSPPARISAAKPRSPPRATARASAPRSPISSPPNSSATRSPAAARSSPTTSTTPRPSRWRSAATSWSRSTPTSAIRAVASDVAAEVDKMVWAIRWGADTVMDLSHRPQHPRHPRMDHPQLARADRHRPHLPGAGEGRRRRRGPDLGNLPRHADRAGRAGRRLFHHPRRRPPALRADDRQARHRHRQPRRLDHGQMVPRPSPRELPLRALRRDLRDHEGLRHRLQPRRRPAPRQHRRRQ